MKATWRGIVRLFLLALFLAQWGPVHAQQNDIQFFPETGHSVRGDFWRYYQSLRDPRLILGYPLTEQITSIDGKTVQYFQRARLELHEERPDDQRVQLTALGQLTYQPSSQLNLSNTAGCEVFPSGYPVCLAFLDFYKANDGAVLFGDPISPFEFHENIIVQYFERARFEWRADRPEGQRVMLTELGRLYFDQLGENKSHLRPVGPLDATINSVLAIKLRAFVGRSVAPSDGQQTVYVIVQSQTGQPIADATGKATVHWPDGHTDDYFFTTNRSGLGTVPFEYADQEPGELVTIEIIAAYEGMAGTTRTSFRIWF